MVFFFDHVFLTLQEVPTKFLFYFILFIMFCFYQIIKTIKAFTEHNDAH